MHIVWYWVFVKDRICQIRLGQCGTGIPQSTGFTFPIYLVFSLCPLCSLVRYRTGGEFNASREQDPCFDGFFYEWLTQFSGLFDDEIQLLPTYLVQYKSSQF
jgi:hypothetical protein